MPQHQHNLKLYLNRFHKLDHLLNHYQPLWRPRPFYQQGCPWPEDYQALYNSLIKLDDSHYQQLQSQQQALIDYLTPFIPEAKTLLEYQPEQISDNAKLSALQINGIPGRKLAQITAFAAAVPNENRTIVDWCAGKGHLARALHWHHNNPVHCLEFDKQLCESGASLANKHQADLTFYHHDVLSPLPPELDAKPHVHVGLHACGQLHMQLLKTASQFAPLIAISPCCYHKVPGKLYQALSNTGSEAQLNLSVDDLHLPQEQTITGGNRIHQLRQQEQLWRLGFDELQKTITGGSYLPLPSLQKSLLNQSFYEFCQWAATQKGLTLPQQFDETTLLTRAKQRLDHTRRLELVRQLFQRPLELWLALDRTLYLFEQGYEAQLQEFCPFTVSPRNLLITARRMA